MQAPLLCMRTFFSTLEKHTSKRAEKTVGGIKETTEENRKKEKRHFTSNQRCRGEESLLLISLDPKFRQAHIEARVVPVGLGP